MKYMGSKNRIAKYILPIILENRKQGQWYVEPFVGGANIIDKVTGNRIGSDTNKYLIALLKKMQEEGFDPPNVSERKYKDIQQNKEEYSDWIVSYAGINLSFAAKFFGGYRRDKKGVRNYANEAQQNLRAQQNGIKGIEFYCCSYDKLNIPSNSVIYCDPPYRGTTSYKNRFDSDGFFAWCKDKVKEGHSVFISEYAAPMEFECVWEKEVSSNLSVDTKGKREIERLFRIKS